MREDNKRLMRICEEVKSRERIVGPLISFSKGGDLNSNGRTGDFKSRSTRTKYYD